MITIIVTLILAGISITTLIGQNGIITRAKQSKIMSELSNYKEEFNLYKVSKKIENQNFDESTLTAGKTTLYYNTQKSGETGNLKSIIPDISDKYFEEIEIIKGELILNTKDKTLIKIAKSLDIKPNPYDIKDGELLSSNGNLLLMDDNGTLTLPSSITKIGEGAFANVDGLKTIIIPGSVKEIEKNAFAYNKTLENVILQDGVEKIGDSAFLECENLKEINLPESLSIIESNAFACCRHLNGIKIPTKIQDIKLWTYRECGTWNSNPFEITFEGDNIKKFDKQAFLGTNLSNITIPSSVTFIDDKCFESCYSLKNIECQSSNFIYDNGMLMSKNSDNKFDNIIFISPAYYNDNKILTLKIPDGVINLPNISQLKIKTLIIPSSLKEWRDNNFSTTIKNVNISTDNKNFYLSSVDDCCIYSISQSDNSKEKLLVCFSQNKDISLKNDKLVEIGPGAFYYAGNAENISLPENVQTLGYVLFANNQNLKKLTLGSKVSNIDSRFATNWGVNFRDNLKLEFKNGNGNISNNNNYFIFENGILYKKNTNTGNKEEIVSVIKKIEGKFIVDESVKLIESFSFMRQKQMTEIILNNAGLSAYALNDCTGLTRIDIPKNVTTIGSDAFSDCYNLNEITLQHKENEISGAPWGAPKGMKVVHWNN